MPVFALYALCVGVAAFLVIRLAKTWCAPHSRVDVSWREWEWFRPSSAEEVDDSWFRQAKK
jgi:hypothetical protein